MEKDIWNELYDRAKCVINPRVISPFIEAGGVGAAILTEDGNIYTGVCIDTASSLGMCAERNAIANMITNGESKIVKLVCTRKTGTLEFPCGACREYLMQLDENSGDIELLKDLETKEIVKLREIVPYWWGDKRFNNK